MTTQAIPQGKLRAMKEIGTHECAQWRDGLFRRFGALRDPVQRHYQWIGSTEGHVAANRWLAEAVIRLKLGRTGLKIDSTHDELIDAANALAKACSFRIHKANRRAGPKATILRIREQVERVGVPFPLKTEPKQASPDEIAGALARVSDEGWWKRQLSRWQPKALEAFNRDLGLVSYQTGAYISNLSFARRQGRKRSNRRLLEKLEAQNDQGQTYTLAELADLSVSNPEIRRTELMVRMRGFEDLANQSPGKFIGLFFTATCPSKYHAAFKTGRRNPKYNGATPAEAQAYLNTVWQRVRAEWQRKGIPPFGMRVVEPHHDGTPHWHLLLFIPTEQAEQATAIFERYALQEDGDEPGAAERRFTTEVIDPTRERHRLHRQVHFQKHRRQRDRRRSIRLGCQAKRPAHRSLGFGLGNSPVSANWRAKRYRLAGTAPPGRGNYRKRPSDKTHQSRRRGRLGNLYRAYGRRHLCQERAATSTDDDKPGNTQQVRGGGQGFEGAAIWRRADNHAAS